MWSNPSEMCIYLNLWGHIVFSGSSHIRSPAPSTPYYPWKEKSTRDVYFTATLFHGYCCLHWILWERFIFIFLWETLTIKTIRKQSKLHRKLLYKLIENFPHKIYISKLIHKVYIRENSLLNAEALSLLVSRQSVVIPAGDVLKACAL